MSKQHNDNTGDFDIPDILPESATDTDLQELTAPLPETFTDLPEADEEMEDTSAADEEGDDDEEEEDAPLPFWHWQHPLFLGLSLPIIGGILLAIVALVVTSLPSSPPADNGLTLTPADTAATNTALRTAHPPSRAMTVDDSLPGLAVPPAGGTDRQALTRALKEEMDQRTDALQSQITKLSGGVAGLSDALRKDEDALRNLMIRVQALEAAARQTTTAPRAAAQPAQTTDTAPASRRTTARSAVSGMRIVSMDSGMAWIRWKDSTWSARQGDRLGSVTITGIDPAERTVTTTGGVIR